jgi:non-ribosomal peptide synthetase component F
MRVSDVLTSLRAGHVALRPHEHSALKDIHGWSDIPAGMPLFNSLVFFENYQLDQRLQALTQSVGECRFQLLERTNYPLSLNAYAGAELFLQLDYDRRYTSDALAAQLLGHLVLLLQAIAADPRQRVAELPLLSNAEQRRILHEWNPAPEPRERACPDLIDSFAEQAAATPAAPAVSSLESAASLSYGELERRANQLARHLAAMGFAPGEVVAWYGERGLDSAVVLLAILEAGGVFLPLDPASPGQRLRFMLDDAEAAWLLCNIAPPPELDGARQVRLDELDWSELPVGASGRAAAALGRRVHHLHLGLHRSAERRQGWTSGIESALPSDRASLRVERGRSRPAVCRVGFRCRFGTTAARPALRRRGVDRGPAAASGSDSGHRSLPSDGIGFAVGLLPAPVAGTRRRACATA